MRTTPDIALYLLNQKRSSITDYEQRFGVSIFIEADAHVGAQHFAIDRGEPVENPVRIDQILQFEPEPEDEEEVLIEEESDEEEVEEIAAERQDPKKGQTDEQGGRKRKRRRRRRGKGAGQGADEAFADAADAAEDETGDEAAVDDAEDEVDATDALNGDSEQKRKRRRRGKRGGRRSRQDELAEAEGETGMAADAGEGVVDDAEAEVAPAEETSPDIGQPLPSRQQRRSRNRQNPGAAARKQSRPRSRPRVSMK